MRKKCPATPSLILVFCLLVALSCTWAVSTPAPDRQGAQVPSPAITPGVKTQPDGVTTLTPDFQAVPPPPATITPDPLEGLPNRIRQEIRKHTPIPGYTPTTGLTTEEETRAIEIALKDPRVQALLAGKNYEVAPKWDDKYGLRMIGRWTTKEGKKLGVSLVIRLDKPYYVDVELPYDEWTDPPKYTTYVTKTYRHTAMVRELMVSIDLYVDPRGNGRVSKIIAM